MSYELAEKAAGIALKSVAKGAPVPEAFARVRQAVLPSLPESVAGLAAELDLVADIDAVCEQLAHVLATEAPDEEINGLCFGLVEMVFGNEDGSAPDPTKHAEHTLYICGSARFDPEDPDWPCDPEWWPETRYFNIPSFKALSDLSATLDSEAAWLVACGLIEPLSILLVGEACRRMDQKTLLGKAAWRGIGSGFDGGDLRDVGVITRDGFASPALVEVTPKPSRATARRTTKAKPTKAKAITKAKTKASKAKSAKAKPAKGKASKAKGSTVRKAAGKKAAKKRAGIKKSGKKQASRKANSKRPASRKPLSKKASRKPSKKKGARRRG